MGNKFAVYLRDDKEWKFATKKEQIAKRENLIAKGYLKSDIKTATIK